jgi:hypothetical protein
VLEPGVHNFFDTVQLGPPHVFDVIEAVIQLPVHCFKPTVDLIEPLVDLIKPHVDVMPNIAQAGVVNQDPDQDRDPGRRGCQGDRE